MYDVITFGSATWDIFLNSNDSKIVKHKKFTINKGICFNLGFKIDVNDIKFSSGGGGTNTAVTFEEQGLKVAYCGGVGTDIPAKEIINDLKKRGIDSCLIVETDLKPTNHSVVLNTDSDKDRTILVYRGASEMLTKKDIPWKKLKETKWFYISALSGRMGDITEDIINFAKLNGIKVAFNPGNYQLKLKNINRMISKVDVLLLNQEEASDLTKIVFKKEKMIFKAIDKMCPGIVIMTKGLEGVVISDGKNIYRAKPNRIKVADRTGAGDSFGAGFVTGLIKKDNIEYAIQLGMANANSCLQKIGAKNGLLKSGANFKNVIIKKTKA
ncbi:carbohydrate kinase family protein [Patescibacteria group bacterium]|nr:carbohydrate kinase family protein [Patescibacteria group bacterium]